MPERASGMPDARIEVTRPGARRRHVRYGYRL
jgi:hypothetical protein